MCPFTRVIVTSVVLIKTSGLLTTTKIEIKDDYPLFWRLSAEEGFPGGYTLEENIQYAAELVKSGVDVINVSFGHEADYAGAPAESNPSIPSSDKPMGVFLHLAEAFKRRVSAPVIAVGRNDSPQMAIIVVS